MEERLQKLISASGLRRRERLCPTWPRPDGGRWPGCKSGWAALPKR